MMMMQSTLLLLLLLGVYQAICFQPVHILPRHSSTRLFSAGGKGFGSKPPPPPKKQQRQSADPPVQATNPVAKKTPQAEATTNLGQQALFEMRRQKAEERDAELRKVRELREMDATIKEAPAAIPEKVANRMGQRMVAFVGVPLFLGLGSFVTFWYMATYKDIEFEPLTVALTTIGILVVGLLGITFSIFSTSWDEDRQGEGGLGLDEAKKNLGNVRQGLGRTRENAILREKLETTSERDMDHAIADLNRREAQQTKQEERNASSS